MEWGERWIRHIPARLRKRSRVLRILLGVRVVALK
jgi:hypothetical protein